MNAMYERILLYCWSAQSFCVLVPKRRGAGYLRVPYGHHEDAGLSRIAERAACDIYGLDGALEFQCGGAIFYGSDRCRKEFEMRVIPLLERHYGMRSKAVSQPEYWRALGLPEHCGQHDSPLQGEHAP